MDGSGNIRRYPRAHSKCWKAIPPHEFLPLMDDGARCGYCWRTGSDLVHDEKGERGSDYWTTEQIAAWAEDHPTPWNLISALCTVNANYRAVYDQSLREGEIPREHRIYSTYHPQNIGSLPPRACPTCGRNPLRFEERNKYEQAMKGGSRPTSEPSVQRQADAVLGEEHGSEPVSQTDSTHAALSGRPAQ